MTTAGDIRGFLLQKPPPHTIQVTTAADDEPTVLTAGNRSRAKLAASILALRPELIQCFDAQGTLLRATRFTDEPDPAKAPAAPPVAAAVTTDPETARYIHTASLIANAYRHATEIAFGKMVDLVNAMNERSASIEQRLERTEAQYRREQADRIEDAWDRVEEEAKRAQEPDAKTELLGTMVNGLVQQKMNGNGAAKANGGR